MPYWFKLLPLKIIKLAFLLVNGGPSFSGLSSSIFALNSIWSAAVCLWVPVAFPQHRSHPDPIWSWGVQLLPLCRFPAASGTLCVRKLAKCVYLSCHPHLLWLQVDSGRVLKWIVGWSFGAPVLTAVWQSCTDRSMQGLAWDHHPQIPSPFLQWPEIVEEWGNMVEMFDTQMQACKLQL